MDIRKSLELEGFTVKGDTCEGFGKSFPLVHPHSIYSKLYREENDPTQKFFFFKKLHDILWPKEIPAWNYWSERRFKTYCEGWRVMSWAAGGHTAKSYDAGKIAVIEYLSYPTKNSVIIASTTLDAVKTRIYGYVLAHLREIKLPVNYTISRGNNPKILYDKDDVLHSMSPIAAARGKDPDAIRNYIGKHPKEKLLLILDEASELDMVVLDAIANLEKEDRKFQILVIATSASKFDLHGVLSTPKGGNWSKIDPMRDTKWETSQKGGICLYFNPYESPAIYEKDPEKRKILEKFLPTKKGIQEKKDSLGEDSYLYWRFCLGFWQSSIIDSTVLSKAFLDQYDVHKKTEWAGTYPIEYVASLDPAFSTGGDKCLLRLAKYGVDINGHVVLDFCGNDLVFNITISEYNPEAAEIQIAKQVTTILNKYGVPLNRLSIDATGQGRALGSVIKLQAGSMFMPIKIYSMRQTEVTPKKSFDVIVKSAHQLWFDLRDYIQRGQIRGLDLITINQLSTRLIEIKNGKPVLESKLDYKRRMGAAFPTLAHSPDEADACALCLQTAIIALGFAPGQRKEFKQVNNWIERKIQYGLAEREAAQKAKENPLMREMPKADFKSGMTDLAKFKPSLR